MTIGSKLARWTAAIGTAGSRASGPGGQKGQLLKKAKKIRGHMVKMVKKVRWSKPERRLNVSVLAKLAVATQRLAVDNP